MRIVCISDTHEQHDDVVLPDGDILIHAGDATWVGENKALKKFSEWFMSQPHKYKIFIGGNHDGGLQLKKYNVPKEIIYLENSGCEIGGLKFWGSPLTPTFGNWYFMGDTYLLKETWDKIPFGLDVLITHGPPYTILDGTIDGRHVGCKFLLDAVEIKTPKHHIFGHIHHSYGVYNNGVTKFVNASICDEDYKPVNKPVVIDLEG